MDNDAASVDVMYQVSSNFTERNFTWIANEMSALNQLKWQTYDSEFSNGIKRYYKNNELVQSFKFLRTADNFLPRHYKLKKFNYLNYMVIIGSTTHQQITQISTKFKKNGMNGKEELIEMWMFVFH